MCAVYVLGIINKQTNTKIKCENVDFIPERGLNMDISLYLILFLYYNRIIIQLD